MASITEEDTLETSVTSISEESISIEEPPPKKRGRRPSVSKASSETPKAAPKPRARSTSAQPPSKPKPAPAGVRGRKPRAAVIPETQVEMSVVEEEEEEVEFTSSKGRQQILPASLTQKTSLERGAGKKDRVKELQTLAEKNFAVYKERAEKRFKATDELVASLTAQLETQKSSIPPSQLKDLESKGTKSFEMGLMVVKSLEEKLQRTQAELVAETAAKDLLNAKLSARSQSSLAQSKEELLSDLSGLYFRSVQRDGGNTIFECIQTGRNGSKPPRSTFLIEALHYKLAMEEKHVNDPHGQVVYTPMLDASRDAKIMSVLPDYLTDEIMFARDQGRPPPPHLVPDLTL
jgi:Chromosome segregation protein Csm1/Pcs1